MSLRFPRPLSTVPRLLSLLLAAGSGLLLAGCRNGSPLDTAPALASARTSPLFDDVYDQSGIQFEVTKPKGPLTILDTIGHGVAMLDADGDGLLDLLFVAPDRISLFHNRGGFRFEAVADAGFRQKGYWTGVAVADADNDGKPDLFVCGYGIGALYRNEGGMKFREVTQSGLEPGPPDAQGNPEWRTGAGFFDYDNDGKPDLFVCRYARFGPKTFQLCGDPTKPERFACSPDVYYPQIGSLFRNEGNGKFRDVSKQMGLQAAEGRALGLAFGDYNGDGWTDIAIANDEKPGDLFTNKGGKKFVNDGKRSGTAYNPNGLPHGGMGADWADYDGDGLYDLFVATYQNEVKSLYHNLGKGVFADVGLDCGLSQSLDKWVSFGSKFFDFDRDGQPDLMVTSGHVISNTAVVYPGTQYRQPTHLFLNRGGGAFAEVTDRMSEKARRLMAGRALAVGDLDNDGRLDVVVTENEGRPLILRGLSPDRNHWVSLRLQGKVGRDAFGAQVKLTAGGRVQMREVTNAGSYLAANDMRLYFGLGATDRVEKVEVRWPGGKTQTWSGLEVDRFYRLNEGTVAPEAYTPPGTGAPEPR